MPKCIRIIINNLKKISGFRAEIQFDRLYTVAVSKMEKMNFDLSGYSRSIIALEKNDSIWKIKMLDEPKKYAITNGTMPPFGTQEYLLSEDLGGGQVSLNINACDDLNEFNCEDGSCIPIERRCDSKFDCFDRSDENTCHMIDVPINYLRHVPAAGREIHVMDYCLNCYK